MERDLRQRDLVPPEALAVCRVTVVGVGAIGRQVALQLAAMGAHGITLIDPDTVEVVNLAPQGYHAADLGRLKVEATAELCRRINPEMNVTMLAERFRRSTAFGEHSNGNGSAGSLNGGLMRKGVLFCCVDSIETRRLIWDAVKQRIHFFTDGRMSAEVVRVLAVSGPKGHRHYPSTLFASSEAFRGTCTAKSTIYSASIAAALMVGQFAKWLRGLPTEPDITLNLLAAEWSVAGEL